MTVRVCSACERAGSHAAVGNGDTTMHGHGTTAAAIDGVGLVTPISIPVDVAGD
jgi:hypothetical protein